MKNATVNVILVMVAGLSCGYMKSNIGISIKPPATPMSVPKAPMNRPIAASNNQMMAVPSLEVQSFQLSVNSLQ